MQRPEYDRRLVGAYLGLGVGFAASALFFAVVGLFLDKRLETSPLFTLIGVIVGGTAGFYNLLRHARAVEAGEGDGDEREDTKQDGSRGEGEPPERIS